MTRRKILPVILGTSLIMGGMPAGAGAAPAAAPDATLEALERDDEGADEAGGDDADRDDAALTGSGSAPGSASVVRDGVSQTYATLAEAVAGARDGETILVSGELELDGTLSVADGRALTLRATGPCTITRSEAFVQAGGKALGMVRLSGGSSLALESDDPLSSPLALDGEDVDGSDAVLTVDGGSSLAIREGVVVRRGRCSLKPWAGVYVRSGSLLLDGGELVGGFAMRNAAVAVERGASFEMRGGRISGNRSTYNEAAVWSMGAVRISGGAIEGNLANSGAEQTGVVYVHGGGTLELTGGSIGGNDVRSGAAIVVSGGSVTMGDGAHVAERLVLKGSATLGVSRALTAHTLADPLLVTLADSWDPGRVVAAFASEQDARSGLSYLSVRTGAATPEVVSLAVDPSDPTRLSVASGEVAELIELLESPFADNLGLTLRDELRDGGTDGLRARLEAAYGDAETPDRAARFERLAWIERQASYLDARRDEVEASVMSLSELGDPAADRSRTQQNFMFDNLDATGYYLRPGQVNEVNLYLDAQDPSRVSLAWRQVGMTESNSYTSLNLQQRSGLANGINRIVVDLSDSQYGHMLYLRNDSASNPARARLEAADANEPGATPVTGSQLGTHPLYLHDAGDPAAFWDFVQEVRGHARLAERGEAQDMALLQMGDQGRAQFAIRASALAEAYAGIASESDAVAYVERSNRAIQERLEFFWAFDGFEEGDGANAISRMRVHTAFSKTVSYPSTMYATGRYFHMPEGSARAFLSGESMYGWGMSHEYGHVLDNSFLVVNEETNNMYSMAGARNGEIIASAAEGRPFSAERAYHPNALRAARLWDEELARAAADPSYAPDWNEGGWGHYIWAHLGAWWNGTHFLDGWDYSGYDHASSPFTEQDADEVARWGAFGATMRMLRGDAEALAAIESATAPIADGTSRKYNRIAMAYTMATGFDFASYLSAMGQRDLTAEVMAFCSQYPEMPRKVQYYSLHTDAAELNGAAPYQGAVTPIVSVSLADGRARVEAEMRTAELEASTTAYELYRDGELVGFSRDGSFETDAPEGTRADAFTVVAYDVRLNQSRPGAATSVPFDLTMPELTVGDEEGAPILVDGPADATYAFEVEDESVATVDPDGTLRARAAGSTTVRVTMRRPGRPDAGPYKFTATVAPREVTLGVADATMRTGAPLPRAQVSVIEGSLLPGDALGEVGLVARAEDGGAADLGEPGTYLLLAEAAGLGPNYLVSVEPGTLTVLQDQAGSDWLVLRDDASAELVDGTWHNGAVSIVAAGGSTEAGTYDELAREGETYAASLRVEDEGELEHLVRLRVGSGDAAGAVSSATAVTTRIDLTAPTVAGELAGGARSAGVVRVTASDNAPEGVNASSGVARVEAVVTDADGAELARHELAGDSHELVVAEAGARAVTLVAVDAAGNASAPVELALGAADAPDGDGAPEGGAPGGNDGDVPGSGGDASPDGDGPDGDGSRPQPDDDPSAPDDDAPGSDDDAPGSDDDAPGSDDDAPDEGGAQSQPDEGANPAPPADPSGQGQGPAGTGATLPDTSDPGSVAGPLAAVGALLAGVGAAIVRRRR